MVKNDEIVYQIATNREDQVIRALVQEYEGRSLLQLRVFYEKDGEWRPTQRGVALPADRLDELEAAVAALRAGLEKKAA